MPRFRKRPVIVEACQYKGAHQELPSWLNDENSYFSYKNQDFLYIKTLEGDMEAHPGDWIVLGIKGETYPVKPDIFEATYEPVNDK